MAKMEDGFGKPLEVRDFVLANAEEGNPTKVLSTLDQYAEDHFFLMNVGPEKGPLLTKEVKKLSAEARVLEFGSYCGYSAILIARDLPSQAQLTCVEIDPESVEGARDIVAFAGLADRVEIIAGASGDMIPSLPSPFDLVFLDHWKDLYEEDLKALEKHQLLRPGAVIFADNVGPLFNPESYLNYVRTCGKYDSSHHISTIEYTDRPDAAEISVFRG
jgi:catechol O-methyltransferase